MAELRAYNPSLRDRIAQMLLGSERPSETKRRLVLGAIGSTGLGSDSLSVADFTPLGMVLSGDEAITSAHNGQYGEAALNALGAVPGGVVTAGVAKVAKAVDKGGKFASRMSKLYDDIPDLPQRPFELDYPNGAQHDNGRLLTDIEGRPLTARRIAGRTSLGASEVALTPREVRSIGEEITGRPVQFRNGGVGEEDGLASLHLDESGAPFKIALQRGLTQQQYNEVIPHEVGHAIDITAGSIPFNEQEAAANYSRLLRVQHPDGRIATPQDIGYTNAEAPYELSAEAVRAYMSNPNYFKTVAPETAANIREYVNNHPKLKNIIQFNSIVAAGGAGALAIGGSDQAEASDMANWWEAAPLVEQPQTGDAHNWWEAAPLVEEQSAQAQNTGPRDSLLGKVDSVMRGAADGWSAATEADKIESMRGTGSFSDATDSILTGIPFGDEIVSGAMAPFKAGISAIQGNGFDIGREYTRSMDLEAELQKRRNERSPIASTVGGVAGGLGVGGVAAKGGMTLLNGAKPTLMSMAGRGTAEGAIWGGLYGAGEGRGLDERLRSAAKGSAMGGVVGGATGALGRIGAGKVDTAGLPTADDLQTAAQAAYKKADDAGVVYSKTAVERIRDQLMGDFADFGYHPELQSGAKVALGEVNRLADQDVTLKGMDTARKIAGNAFQMGNKSNNALTGKVTSAIDDLIANPQAGDVISGNGAAASDAIKEARRFYSQARKLDTVNQMMERAGLRAATSGSGANIENTTRQELNKILKSDKLKRSFNPAELSALKEAVMGTKTQNLLRGLGKFAPTGVVSGGAGASTGAFVGGLIGGPVGAAAGAVGLPAIGFGAKVAADAGARNSARMVEALIASGGTLPQPQLSATKKAIIDMITRGGAQQLRPSTGQ